MACLLKFFVFALLLSNIFGTDLAKIWSRSDDDEKVTLNFTISNSNRYQSRNRPTNYTIVNVCLGKENVIVKCQWLDDYSSRYYSHYESDVKIIKNDAVVKENRSRGGTTVRIDFTESNDFNLTAKNTYYCQGYASALGTTIYSPAIQIVYYDCPPKNNIETITKQSVDLGGSRQLKCWNGPKKSNFTSEWHLQGIWSGKRQLIDNTEYLNLVDISHQDVGIYTCYVWFEHIKYRHVKKFDLRLMAAPLQPIKLRLANVTQNSFTFVWESDPFDHLTLADDAATRNSFKITLNKAYRWETDPSTILTTSETTITISDLTPNTPYRIEVRATNANGESGAARYDFFTRNDTVIDPDINYDAQITAKINQRVTIPCRRYGNVQEIKWRKLSEILPRNQSIALTKGDGLGSYIIESVVETDSGLYQCEAPYPDGANDMQDIFITRVSILVQPKRLLNLTCSKISGNVLVTWISSNGINEHPSVSDMAEKIRIRYHKMDGNFVDSWEEQTTSPDRINASISGLDNGFLYVFRLTAVNDAGESGPASVACNF